MICFIHNKMTRRKLKNHKPSGYNKHLGNNLVNSQKFVSKNKLNLNIPLEVKS